nr:hypothetical protein [Candidatus Dadabacteria bacterium]
AFFFMIKHKDKPKDYFWKTIPKYLIKVIDSSLGYPNYQYKAYWKQRGKEIKNYKQVYIEDLVLKEKRKIPNREDYDMYSWVQEYYVNSFKQERMSFSLTSNQIKDLLDTVESLLKNKAHFLEKRRGKYSIVLQFRFNGKKRKFRVGTFKTKKEAISNKNFFLREMKEMLANKININQVEEKVNVV